MERKTINVKVDLDISEVSSHVESITPDSNVQNNDNNNEVSKLKEEISLQAKNIALREKYDKDTADLKSGLFRMERFIASDADFRFYTGFPNYNSFKAPFHCLSPACEHLVYYHGTTTAPVTSEHQIKCGKPRLMSLEQKLLLVLIRLRFELLVQDIAHRFNTSASHVSDIFKTWLVFLNQRLRALPSSRKFVDDNMPACFKVAYPKPVL